MLSTPTWRVQHPGVISFDSNPTVSRKKAKPGTFPYDKSTQLNRTTEMHCALSQSLSYLFQWNLLKNYWTGLVRSLPAPRKHIKITASWKVWLRHTRLYRRIKLPLHAQTRPTLYPTPITVSQHQLHQNTEITLRGRRENEREWERDGAEIMVREKAWVCVTKFLENFLCACV